MTEPDWFAEWLYKALTLGLLASAVGLLIGQALSGTTP